MINDINEITDIFNIFHDGDITAYEKKGNDLKLTISIPYLAERIEKEFSYFIVTLNNYKKIQFETWPNQQNKEHEYFNDLKEIFQAILWILEAEHKEGVISVACSQADSSFNFCGGKLSFVLDSATVTDEANKEYSIKELGDISESYWDEWKNGK